MKIVSSCFSQNSRHHAATSDPDPTNFTPHHDVSVRRKSDPQNDAHNRYCSQRESSYIRKLISTLFTVRHLSSHNSKQHASLSVRSTRRERVDRHQLLYVV